MIPVIEYDVFTGAFLAKITEYDFANIICDETRTDIVDDYMKKAISHFNRICSSVSEIDFSSNAIDYIRAFDIDIEDDKLDELVDIISEGMIVQWLKPYVYDQELLQQQLNTVDFTTYSPANLLAQVGATYKQARKDFRNMMHDFSYSFGDLTELHL